MISSNTIFVGGPGRSGTSFFAAALSAHPEICTFPDVELKIFSETDGIWDLYNALVTQFSPQRAPIAVERFLQLVGALLDNDVPNQASLSKYGARSDFEELAYRFILKFKHSALPHRQTPEFFFQACRELIHDLSSIAKNTKENPELVKFFLEKTPHSLLQLDLLHRLAPNGHYIHVMRDPRSIAASLVRMPWGPPTFDVATEWLGSYLDAWNHTQEIASMKNIVVHKLYIEDIARQPERASIFITESLGLTESATLFSEGGASLEQLNGWVSSIDDRVKNYLDKELEPYIEELGYHPTEIGLRTSS